MARKPMPYTPARQNTPTAAAKPKDGKAEIIAINLLRLSIRNAITIQEFSQAYGESDFNKLVDTLTEQTKQINEGNLQRAEAILICQAHTLDALFTTLALRANRAEYLDHFDRYLRLALKAQSQCRATLETLATIKNPPNVAFVNQANIAHTQQVNNAAPAHARENNISQTELLEATDGERLDTGTAGAAGNAYQDLAAVGEVHRTKDPSG